MSQAESPGSAKAAAGHTAKFVTGSTMRHVIVMTATGSIGLVAIFIVDALNLFYISLLGVQSLTAAIGFAATLLFFTISVAIGFTIACSALVSRSLGRGSRDDAARLAGASMVFMVLTTTAMSAAVWPFLREITAALGATGATLESSVRFLQVVLPSTPVVALGMCTTGILRGVGDAQRAMYVTLGAGIAAAIFDPIFIFGLHLGLDGAAISTVLSRFVLLAVGLHGAHYVHHVIALPTRERLLAAARPFFAIGLPAVLTQLGAPVGNAFVTAEIARFGDGTWPAGRHRPHRPGSLGVICPVGRGGRSSARIRRRRFDRLQATMRDSLIVTTVYVLAVQVQGALFAGPIASSRARRQARELIIFFCVFVAMLPDGAIFVSSAAFNNLGYPTYSTVFNWGRSTFGIIPFAWVGGLYFGAEGVLAGRGLGAVIFGIASMVVCFRTVAGIARGQGSAEEPVPALPPSANSPFSTGKASTL